MMTLFSIFYGVFCILYLILTQIYKKQIIDFCLRFFDKEYKISKEHDCAVHNWLTEDELNISFPSYAYRFKNVHTIKTPIGNIWIGNYPYLFGHLYSDDIFDLSGQPSDETKEKLFLRLIDFGLIYDHQQNIFKLPTT